MPNHKSQAGIERRPLTPVDLAELNCRINVNTDGPRESFNDIYLDLSKEPGKCRIAESGLGWRPHNGETFTLDKAEFVNAQWSRAARGHELKIFARNAGVVQLDGFKQDVSELQQ